MRIKLIGEKGGIGSAIKKNLSQHDFTEQNVDWLIFAQGFIGEDEMAETFDANIFTCIEITEKYIRYLKEGVIYISSTAGITGNSKFPVYAASKAALNNYTKSMAKAHPMLSFYALCPGPTNTKMWKSLGISGQPQEPIEVAKAVQQILEGKFLSGSIITVRDGEICLIQS